MCSYEEKLYHHQRMYDEYERQVIANEIQRRARYHEAIARQLNEYAERNEAYRSRYARGVPFNDKMYTTYSQFGEPSRPTRSKTMDLGKGMSRRRRDETPLCSRTVGYRPRDTHFLDAEDGRPTPPLLLAASMNQSRYPPFGQSLTRSASSKVQRSGTIIQKFVQNAEAKSHKLREKTKGFFEPNPNADFKASGYDSHTTLYTNGVRLTWDEAEGSLRDEQGKRWYLDANGIIWCPPQE
ncbi:hypothetical protein FRC03_012204 [Tulasnella sp. 419]|nr:hypothetical protein FRC02_005374 [Tulasnella sp. 418]KAG8966302.1 hypothetical protein FRC03_012204 [Tulasnella sp. 419]